MRFCELSPEEVLTWEILLSLVLIDGRSVEELNILGNALTVVGAILMTQAASLDCSQANVKDQDKDYYESLVKAIAALELRLTELENK